MKPIFEEPPQKSASYAATEVTKKNTAFSSAMPSPISTQSYLVNLVAARIGPTLLAFHVL
jgi:hypothetical protein